VRAVRLTVGALGLAAMAYAVVGAVSDDGVDLPGVLSFMAVVLFSHDLLLMPIAVGVGYIAVRVVPGWARAWVQVGLFASTVVVAVALPFVIGAGKLADNASKLPLNYGRGLGIVLVTIWTVVVAAALVARRSRRIGGSPAQAVADKTGRRVK
jgi:hypothetical protein